MSRASTSAFLAKWALLPTQRERDILLRGIEYSWRCIAETAWRGGALHAWPNDAEMGRGQAQRDLFFSPGASSRPLRILLTVQYT